MKMIDIALPPEFYYVHWVKIGVTHLNAMVENWEHRGEFWV